MKLRKLQTELKKLNDELNSVKKAPAPIAEQTEAALDDLKVLQKERVEFFARFITRCQTAGHRPFTSVSMHTIVGSAANKRYLLCPTEAEVRAAYALLGEPEGALSAKAKASLIGKLQKKISDLKKEIQELSPPEYFLMKDGIVVTDFREKFFAGLAKPSKPLQRTGFGRSVFR